MESVSDMLGRWAKGDTRPALESAIKKESKKTKSICQSSLSEDQKKSIWQIARTHEVRLHGIHCNKIR